MSVVIPSGGQVGSLYAVPQSDWVAINRRVDVVIQVEGIADVVRELIPNYDRLLAVCKQWQTTTLPGLILQSVNASTFAQQAVTTLTRLASELQPLKPGDPLPDAVGFIFRVDFDALQQNAGKQSTAASPYLAQITNFVTENRAADAVLDSVISQLGTGWEGVTGPIASLETAMQDVPAGWNAVQAAFSTAASQQPDLTTAALLSLNIQATIASWNTVITDAVGFNGRVTAQPAAS